MGCVVALPGEELLPEEPAGGAAPAAAPAPAPAPAFDDNAFNELVRPAAPPSRLSPPFAPPPRRSRPESGLPGPSNVARCEPLASGRHGLCPERVPPRRVRHGWSGP